jgi:hypothetical protein
MKIDNYKHHHLNHFELHPLHLQQQETHTHKWRTYDKKENTNLKNQKRHKRAQTWKGHEEKFEYKLILLNLGSQPLLINLIATIIFLKLWRLIIDYAILLGYNRFKN